MRFAFVDESGTVAVYKDSYYFVTAIISLDQPRAIEMHVRRAHKKFGTSLKSGEMKADQSSDVTIMRLLQAITSEPIEIITLVVDKRVILRPPDDPENIYREVVSLAIRQVVSRWPRIEIHLDKRYTTKRLRRLLEREIRERIADLHQEVVLIHQDDSIARKELQAADFIAWAIFQKYERDDSRFYDLIADRLVVEEVIERDLW